jgi:endo-alpha-1,4-polygalactosaminidase (GH114 family)
LLLDKYIKNEIQFLDEHKQKKATYDPLGLASNYKSYFKNKEEKTS